MRSKNCMLFSLTTTLRKNQNREQFQFLGVIGVRIPRQKGGIAHTTVAVQPSVQPTKRHQVHAQA